MSQSQGFGAGSADTAQCTGNASRERLRTVRCVSHRAGTVCRTSAARVTHACMTQMHAEGSAATDRDILAQGSSPVRGTPWRRESLEARRDVERRRSSSPSYAVELRLRGASCNGALYPPLLMHAGRFERSERSAARAAAPTTTAAPTPRGWWRKPRGGGPPQRAPRADAL